MANIIEGVGSGYTKPITAGDGTPITSIPRDSSTNALAVDSGTQENTALAEMLCNIRIELTAIRLGIQEQINAGLLPEDQIDLLEMARNWRDREEIESEEP